MNRFLERIADGPVICAEGYLFEFERRGYLQAGAFVPEVVLDHPELVAQLHREFVHAGSDVVEAFTYYAHREKLRLIGKEDALEEINRQALQIAGDVAKETGALLAGDICNTNIFDPDDADSVAAVRGMFSEQVGWAVDAGVDFIIGETFSWGAEAQIALEVIAETGLPAVITLAVHRAPETREGWTPEDACRRLEDAGAAVVGLNCIRGPRTMLPLVKRVREACEGHVAALPVPYRTTDERAELPVADRSGLRLHPGRPPVPDRAGPLHVQPLRAGGVHPRGRRAGGRLPGRVLRRGAAPHPRRRRGAGTHAAGVPLQRGHEPSRVPRLRRQPQDGQPLLRR